MKCVPETNVLPFLRRVVQELHTAGFRPLVFGGWAEELYGSVSQRQHRDIDLLLVDPVLDDLDQFLAQRAEIVRKRFSHKRAYVVEGVLVELLLVESSADGYTTTFFGTRHWRWPDLTAPVTVTGLPLAPAEALAMYRTNHAAINAARPAP
jgi:hypothetical protein